MTRRLTILAAAAFGLVLGVQNASALTAETRACIKNSRSALRSCRVEATANCRSQFQSTFEGCFGPGAACATACSQQQAGCQAPAAETQATCGLDCGDTFKTALDGCRDKPDPASRLDCTNMARLDQFTCRQACALAAQPALQACSADFSNCLQACASTRTPPQ